MYFFKIRQRRIRKARNITDTAKYLQYKEEARHKIINRVMFFSNIYNVKYNRIAIRNQKTRWGSCSRQGNLNFNYKMLFLTDEIVDYIVVHELCHLIEFNHSQKFWSEVAKAVPDYVRKRKELRAIEINELKLNYVTN